MRAPRRTRHTFRLPPELARHLADHAARRRVPQAAVVEAALASFLSPDAAEQLEAAFSRRLDRLSRQFDRLDYHVEVGNEALALFVRFWLMSNAPLAAPDRAAAQAQASERFAEFVAALARRMESPERISERLAGG